MRAEGSGKIKKGEEEIVRKEEGRKKCGLEEQKGNGTEEGM